MSHALITGATGFIGRQLLKRLSEQGFEITCLVRQHSDLQPLAPYSPRLVPGDVLDSQAVREAVKSVDVVFHLAGQTKAVHSRELFRVNEAGTRTVAAACARSPTPPLLIHVSSIAAAGPSQRGYPKQEDDPATPVSQYGRSKLAGELALQEFATSLPISIVRPPIVLGPGDRTGLAGGTVKFRRLQGRAMCGSQTRQQFRLSEANRGAASLDACLTPEPCGLRVQFSWLVASRNAASRNAASRSAVSRNAASRRKCAKPDSFMLILWVLLATIAGVTLL